MARRWMSRDNWWVLICMLDIYSENANNLRLILNGNKNNDCLKSYYITSCSIFHFHNSEIFITIQLMNNSK